MSKKDFVTIALRVLAVWLFISMLDRIPDIVRISIAADPQDQTYNRLMLFAILFQFAVSGLLITLCWTKSGWLARQIFQGTVECDAISTVADEPPLNNGERADDETTAQWSQSKEIDFLLTRPIRLLDLERFAFSILGAWITFSAITNMLYLAFSWGMSSSTAHSELASWLHYGLLLVFGLSILLRPYGVQNIIIRFRKMAGGME